jgi:hypothetical protein
VAARVIQSVALIDPGDFKNLDFAQPKLLCVVRQDSSEPSVVTFVGDLTITSVLLPVLDRATTHMSDGFHRMVTGRSGLEI